MSQVLRAAYHAASCIKSLGSSLASPSLEPNCHFSLREKSSDLIKIPDAQDLSLRSK
uniref:Uncharacterized protein n=1 Tax=Candidatus Kentrum sp. TUN TaxID=2126343 RepID=A0A451AKN1_9GAMM|nr:MAG: hypothetical protein BECKTUN1418D_GA0071000_10528 [Candidatus Kentron sp. TUN]VFK66593.1 MAG: hypothetical protein BECKTUN1418E_GA0071001_11233 [Candidatus Kentron sp. TUN]